jgi:hypothetical protein
MPTRIVIRRQGSTGTDGMIVQEGVAAVAASINRAVKSGTKFVTLTGEDGKAIALDAGLVQSMVEA